MGEVVSSVMEVLAWLVKGVLGYVLVIAFLSIPFLAGNLIWQLILSVIERVV